MKERLFVDCDIVQLEALCESLWLARFVRFLIFQFQPFFYRIILDKLFPRGFLLLSFNVTRFYMQRKSFVFKFRHSTWQFKIPSPNGELNAAYDSAITPTTFPKTFKCSSSRAAILDACNASPCKWHSICVLLKIRWNINFHSECNDGVDTLRFTEQFILRIPEAFARFWTQHELQRQTISCFFAQSNFFSRVYFSINFAQIHFSLPQKNYKNLRSIFFLAFSINFFSPNTRLRKPHICKWLII